MGNILLRVFMPAFRKMEQLAIENAEACTRAEAALLDATMELAEARKSVIASQQKIVESEVARLEDTRRMLDWMCVAQRFAPIFNRAEDLPPAPPPPSQEPISLRGKQAEDYEREFNEKMEAALASMMEPTVAT